MYIQAFCNQPNLKNNFVSFGFNAKDSFNYLKEHELKDTPYVEQEGMEISCMPTTGITERVDVLKEQRELASFIVDNQQLISNKNISDNLFTIITKNTDMFDDGYGVNKSRIQEQVKTVKEVLNYYIEHNLQQYKQIEKTIGEIIAKINPATKSSEIIAKLKTMMH